MTDAAPAPAPVWQTCRMVLDSHTLAQLLVVTVVIGLLGVVLRWTFGGARDPRPGAGAGGPEDFGLLAAVATVDSAEQADRVRALLSDAGIRATASLGADARYRVLVFASELEQARRHVGDHA
jgi:hypothetical protein